MAQSLASLPNSFSESSRARCFTHIINLVARTITHQFDNAAKKVRKLDRQDDVEDEDEEAEEDVRTPELAAVLTSMGLEDWVDDLETMSEEQLRDFARDTKPVRTVLCKVSISTSFTTAFN